MPFVDDTQRAELLAKANEAIATSDAARSNELYRDIVQTITILCNKNQKEIAGELQNLAKAIEEKGLSTEAFEFKQRTCAVMLEISMEDRRRMKLEGAKADGASVSPAAPARPSGGTIIGAPASSGTIIGAPGTSGTGSGAPGQGGTIIGAGSSNHNSSGENSSATNTGSNIPSTSTGQDRSLSAAQSNFAPSSPAASSAPTAPASRPSRLIGVDTREIEPFSVDAHAAKIAAAGDQTRIQSSATAIDTALPFLSVEYLYMGTSDYERDLTYYREVLGAQEVWKFDRFGSKITAFSLSAGPLILLSDSRQAPSCQPVFRVSDLSSCARDLTARGWKPVAGPFGTPNGEAYSFEDPSGNRFAIFQVDETSTDRAYFDPTEGE